MHIKFCVVNKYGYKTYRFGLYFTDLRGAVQTTNQTSFISTMGSNKNGKIILLLVINPINRLYYRKYNNMNFTFKWKKNAMLFKVELAQHN